MKHPNSDARPSLGIELIELETFVSLAETQSFSVAARRMHVSQPTVTGRVQRLENAVGTRLFRRTTRRVELTLQGSLLLAETIKCLEGLRGIAHRSRAKARRARQAIVMAATPTLATWMPRIIGSYSARFPLVEIELRDLQYSQALAAIEDGSVDFAVLAISDDTRLFKFQSLWSDDMVLVIPKNHPLAAQEFASLTDFSKYTLILVEQYQGLRQNIVDALKRHHLALPASRVVANLLTAIGMLDAGMGMALVTRSFIPRKNIGSHIVLEIQDIQLTRRFGIVSAQRENMDSAAKKFSKFLADAVLTERRADVKK